MERKQRNQRSPSLRKESNIINATLAHTNKKKSKQGKESKELQEMPSFSIGLTPSDDDKRNKNDSLSGSDKKNERGSGKKKNQKKNEQTKGGKSIASTSRGRTKRANMATQDSDEASSGEENVKQVIVKKDPDADARLRHKMSVPKINYMEKMGKRSPFLTGKYNRPSLRDWDVKLANQELQKIHDIMGLENGLTAGVTRLDNGLPAGSPIVLCFDADTCPLSKAEMYLNHCRSCINIYTKTAETLERRITEANAGTSGKDSPIEMEGQNERNKSSNIGIVPETGRLNDDDDVEKRTQAGERLSNDNDEEDDKSIGQINNKDDNDKVEHDKDEDDDEEDHITPNLIDDAEGSKEESKKGAEPWRCEENKLRYERNKQELILTESEEEELGSDLEEFLWTYNDDTPYEEYEAAVQKNTEELVQKATANLLSYIKEKHKKLDAESAEVKPSSK
ncbi:hypothetical protein QL285_082277 [Trifolium repens]|nr:hypothetical protein QL285_082277 [Trifolium repens]